MVVNTRPVVDHHLLASAYPALELLLLAQQHVLLTQDLGVPALQPHLHPRQTLLVRLLLLALPVQQFLQYQTQYYDVLTPTDRDIQLMHH